MADKLSQTQRSELMGRIKGRDTSPERVVRAIIRRLRVTHRLHAFALPGSPDIVIDALKTVIFVHGCFWHRHSCPRGGSSPSIRRAFWQAKFTNNTRRDRQAARALRRLGWRVVIVWECQTTPVKRRSLAARLRRLFSSPLSTNGTSVFVIARLARTSPGKSARMRSSVARAREAMAAPASESRRASFASSCRRRRASRQLVGNGHAAMPPGRNGSAEST